MNSKHTQGPWSIHADPESTTVEIWGPRGVVIAEVGAHAALVAADDRFKA